MPISNEFSIAYEEKEIWREAEGQDISALLRTYIS